MKHEAKLLANQRTWEVTYMQIKKVQTLNITDTSQILQSFHWVPMSSSKAASKTATYLPSLQHFGIQSVLRSKCRGHLRRPQATLCVLFCDRPRDQRAFDRLHCDQVVNSSKILSPGWPDGIGHSTDARTDLRLELVKLWWPELLSMRNIARQRICWCAHKPGSSFLQGSSVSALALPPNETSVRASDRSSPPNFYTTSPQCSFAVINRCQ